jgi:hypothetical protein
MPAESHDTLRNDFSFPPHGKPLIRLTSSTSLRGAKTAKFINDINRWESRVEKLESNPATI